MAVEGLLVPKQICHESALTVNLAGLGTSAILLAGSTAFAFHSVRLTMLYPQRSSYVAPSSGFSTRSQLV